MDTVKVENIGINAVDSEICKYDVLIGHLKDNDKSISKDGYIELYSKNQLTSKNLLGEIPVQVKGKSVMNFSPKYIKHSVKKVDLENFIQDGKGAIYFVVEILPNVETKIFYYVFTYENTNKILKNMKKNAKSKRIEFQELKSKELIEKVVEVYNSWKKSPIKIEKIKKEIKANIASQDEYTIEKNRFNEIVKENKFFVKTKPFIEAKRILERDNIVLLHGEPWIGKTTIANELVKIYNKKGYKFIYGRANDIAEVEKKIILNRGQKIICLVDDFLGSNVNYLKNSELDLCLTDLIKKFKNRQNQKLILTTRTYIYNNAKELFNKFYHCTEIIDEDLVNVGDYTNLEKAQILYNHLKKNNLLWTNQYIKLIDNKYYERIIMHSNFNPGMIAHICETIKNIDTNETIKYIEELLENPEKIWDREYNKLNFYEKILLNIITLFGYKTPEDYIKEQFIAFLIDEKSTKVDLLKLEDEFGKALKTLSTSFVKAEFDNKNNKTLDTCKHSVRDYIIAKIKNDKLDIKSYIENAKYVDMINYIDMYCNKEEISEQVASKLEKDYEKLEEYQYSKFSIMYHIFSEHLTLKREEMVQYRLSELFEKGKGYEIIGLLDEEDNIFYSYLLEAFKKYELEDLKSTPYFFDNPFRILSQIDDTLDMENYLKACSLCVKKKNHKFMLERIEDILEILDEILINEILDDISENIPNYTINLLEEGKTIQEISILYAKDIINTELPSLKSLYTKGNYEYIVENVSEACIIDEETLIDFDIDIETIKKNVNKNKELEKEIVDREKEEKYIKELFEGKEVESNNNRFTQILTNYIIYNKKI